MNLKLIFLLLLLNSLSVHAQWPFLNSQEKKEFSWLRDLHLHTIPDSKVRWWIPAQQGLSLTNPGQKKIQNNPPFWATWRAYVLYALVFLLLLRYYWKFIDNRIPHTLILTPLDRIVEPADFSELTKKSIAYAWEHVSHLFRMIHQNPNLIISDAMMPVVDGSERGHRVKRDERISQMYVLPITSKTSPDKRIAGLSAGVDDYLAKASHWNAPEQTIRTRFLQQQRLRKHLQQKALTLEIPMFIMGTSNEFVDTLYQEIDKLIANSAVSVDALAQSLHMSRRTLSRKLKMLMDVTPNEFIRRYRLQKAAVLLGQGWSAAQVAYEVGFESPSYFAQCFKEQYGTTPSTFTQQA